MHTTTVNVSTGEIVQIPYTTEELAEYDIKKAAWDAGANDRKAVKVRAERDTKLAETDWRFRSDMTPSQAWKDYCQALRDVPLQSGFPWTITWPVEPQ
jgi:hypothetical protein